MGDLDGENSPTFKHGLKTYAFQLPASTMQSLVDAMEIHSDSTSTWTAGP